MIDARHLGKHHGAHAALADVTLQVAPGEAIGVLGANGAGKTTLLTLLAAQARPSAGTLHVAGLDARRQPAQVRARAALVAHAPPPCRHLPLRAALELVACIHRTPAPTRAVEAALERADLRAEADGGAPIATLSHGTQRRCALALALVRGAPLLLLDEPTAGLDLLQARQLRRALQHMRGTATQVVSCHQPGDAAALGGRLVLLRAGRIAFVGTAAELMATQAPAPRAWVQVRGDAEALHAALRPLSFVRPAAAMPVPPEMAGIGDGAAACVELAAEARPALLRALVAAGLDVLRLQPQATSLEDAVAALLGSDAELPKSDHARAMPS